MSAPRRFGIPVNALLPGTIAAGGFVADPALAVLSNPVPAYVTGAAIVAEGGLSLTNSTWFDPPALDDL
jgi:3-oxoacyl-[acyl-carrier protein] reductase